MKRRGFLALSAHAALLALAPLGWAARRVLPDRVVVALRGLPYPGRVSPWNSKQRPGPGPWAG
ncbi:MAG TPA: hypothetical protein PKI11_15120 [Candidatus Hydrogenedentes bacterium]|nr:hypothetical protein [Candidatus Hydrogenedentota bacterium]HNT86360.1 hypothetical protein [Candidatus Hydrogenedentota bacterium]